MSQTSVSSIGGRDPGKSIYQETAQSNVSAKAAITIGKLGWWSAVLSSFFGAGYGLAVITMIVSNLTAQTTSGAAGWEGIDAYVAGFRPILMLPMFPSLLLIPAFTALMVTIHTYAAEDKKIWSGLGLAFTLIYASLAAFNYLVQLLPVWRSISNGEADGLAMFAAGNPHSIFWGLAYTYIFMNLAMLLTAPVFIGSPLKKRVRVLFMINGISGVFTLASALIDSPPFYLLGSVVIWCPVFVAATISAAILFKRVSKAENIH